MAAGRAASAAGVSPGSRRIIVLRGIAALILLAALVRLAFLLGVPELWTLDSRSYLRIALKIARDGSFADDQLGVLRMPGYPLFLTAVRTLFGHSAAALLGAQAALGLVSTAAGFALGRRLTGSLRGALSLGLLIGLGPYAIGLEHAVMSEALALAALLVASLLLLRFAEEPDRPAIAALAGLAVAACLLVRLNAALFLAVLAALPLSAAWRSRRSASRRALVASGACFLAALALVLAPWLERNRVTLGRASLFASPVKVALVYAIQHGVVEADRLQVNAGAESAALARDPGLVTFWRMVAAGGPVGSERLAREALETARVERAAELGAARRAALRRWSGFSRESATPDLVRWLGDLEAPDPRVAHARTVGRRFLEPRTAPPHAASVAALEAGIRIYLRWVRPALLLAGAVALAVLAGRALRRRRAPGDGALLVFGAAYLATLALHVRLLADYERFAVPFDWVALALAVQALMPARSVSTHGGGLD